jgi:hypothetical protein
LAVILFGVKDMSTRLKLARNEVSDEVLAELVLELAREEEDSLQRLCSAVLADDTITAKQLAKELQGQ